jgi:putative methionine-R-sulfoxide reductase with GAF domain
MGAARDARVYVEIVVEPRSVARDARVYVEVVVPTFEVGGWAVGVVRMGSN